MLELKWDAERGQGYYPVDEYLKTQSLPEPYDQVYFEKYQGYAATEMGRKLNEFRLKTVNRLTNGLVVDIGIGSGQFVDVRNAQGKATLGHDVNPLAVAWLKERGLLAEINKPMEVVTFWDSLEHIKEPKEILQYISRFAVVAMPIYKDYRHVVNSKHFRPTEHYHYFTHTGFVAYMWNQGLRLTEYSDVESDLGREDVRTFVFRRV